MNAVATPELQSKHILRTGLHRRHQCHRDRVMSYSPPLASPAVGTLILGLAMESLSNIRTVPNDVRARSSEVRGDFHDIGTLSRQA